MGTSPTDDAETKGVAVGAELRGASDVLLVAAVARRHRIALDEIFRRHVGAVYAIAHRLLKERAKAATVVHDVFVGFWTAPEEFDPLVESLRSHLLTQTFRIAGERQALDESAPGRACAPDPVVVHARLPVDDGTAMELACIPGSSYRDIAMYLGETEATVRARIRAQLMHLRSDRFAMGSASPPAT